MKLKQTLIATAVAAAVLAPAAAMAEASMYGSARASLTIVDDGDDTSTEVKNHSSRWGFKGSEDIGNGLTAFGHYEMGLSTAKGTFGAGSQTNRLAYIGAKGGFGELRIGTQWGAYYSMVGGTTDQFNAVGADHIRGTFRLPNALGYVGSFGPAKVMATFVMKNDDAADEDNIDRIQLGAKFNAGPVAIGIGVDSLSDFEAGGESGNAVGIGATYAAGGMTFAAAFTNTDKELVAGDEAEKMIEVYAAFTVGDRDTIRASYGQTDNGDNTPNSISLGYNNRISGSTRLWVEGQIDNADQKGVDDTTEISLGFRHDW